MKQGHSPGTVYLVGAGPGDPGLITVRGMELLRKSDVLLYDSLVSEELVNLSPARERIYVGKTKGGRAFEQEDINARLVELALSGQYTCIVRLKGGDPFVFGRGGEEALACAEAGVPFEVVPGVTAGVAVPASVGIPVTHRKLSRGFSIITGNREDGHLDLPWKAYVDSGLTLVMYMAVSTLPQIVDGLTRAGMSPETPAVMIQEGTLPGARSVGGQLRHLPDLVTEANIRPPAVLIIGEVAALRDRIRPTSERPLAGKTVLLAKSEHAEYPQLERLRSQGARVIEVAVQRSTPLYDTHVVSFFSALKEGDAIVFPSTVSARNFAFALGRHVTEVGGKTSLPRKLELHPGTTGIGGTLLEALHAAVSRGMLNENQWQLRIAEGEVWPETFAEQKKFTHTQSPRNTVWIPVSDRSPHRIEERLKEVGVHACSVRMFSYEPVPLPGDIQALVRQGRVDGIMLLSATTAATFLAAVPEVVGHANAGGLLVCAYSGGSAEVAAAHGVENVLHPVDASIEGMVTQLAAKLGDRLRQEQEL